MSNETKHRKFSLFGNKKQDREAQEAAERESRQRLEKRIEQVLAEAAAAPIVEESPALAQAEVAEVLPITASALNQLKANAPSDFWQVRLRVNGHYAVK